MLLCTKTGQLVYDTGGGRGVQRAWFRHLTNDHAPLSTDYNKIPGSTLALSKPQSRFGGTPIKFEVVCPQNGTAVLKGSSTATETDRNTPTY